MASKIDAVGDQNAIMEFHSFLVTTTGHTEETLSVIVNIEFASRGTVTNIAFGLA